jgi:hypothetical protein
MYYYGDLNRPHFLAAIGIVQQSKVTHIVLASLRARTIAGGGIEEKY